MVDKKTLNIGFDAKRAVLNDTGLGGYSREVLARLSALHPSWRMHLYTPRMRRQPRLDDLLARPEVTVELPRGAWTHMSSLWRVRSGITRQLRADGIDLYHGLSNELPLDIAGSGIPSVVTVHDVIYRRCPDNYTAIDRRIYDFKYGRSARNATRVVAISRCTARDITEIYQVDPAKIDIVYQSCHPQFALPVAASDLMRVKTLYKLPGRYMAIVGTVERRKNQILAVRALPMIDPEVKLVIVGRGRLGYDAEVMREARRLKVDDRVMMLSSLPFGDLPAIYAGAEVAAYVSIYEGFGLPVVEALSAGTPVIAASGSCLEEAGGQGAVYVHPADVDAFAREANRLLADTAVRERMVDAGRRHIAATLSTPLGEALTAVYDRTLRAFGE